MGDTTGIAWTDATWNPVTGCSHVSPGCANCYAEKLSLRFGRSAKPWTAPNAAENVQLHPERLDQPLKWRKPRRVFVNSMSDLFHERVPDEYIARVFAVMALAPRHSFQVLTKRPERMAALLAPGARIFDDGDGDFADRVMRVATTIHSLRGTTDPVGREWEWPLPNVWLGTSVEDQRRADERIPWLLKTPAAVRFLSCEPLLEPVDLTPHLSWLDWVIVGGESGPGYRPMNLDWMRALRDQCQAADVAFFAKQPSGPRPGMALPADLQVQQYPEVGHA